MKKKKKKKKKKWKIQFDGRCFYEYQNSRIKKWKVVNLFFGKISNVQFIN